MREIKFRAWHKTKKGGYFYEPIIFEGKSWEFTYDGMEPLSKTYKNDILCQFTGLKDKNGVEIYDGDIIEYYRIKTGTRKFYPDRTKRKSVKWEEYNRCIGYNLKPITKEGEGYWKVIGNIYENPELLKGAK